ncbi:unnamed protein product [Bemisia tabaci]|uniref:Endothelin-converting enzyme 1 n=1 Tax=Bemisia tabaci TaxID=7038 RepID=A0A9P0A6Z3_BEMTA|nr:unnamed protein product [Bemisia tabaci]
MASTETEYPTLEAKKVSENGVRSGNDDSTEGDISEKQPCLDPKTNEVNNATKLEDDTDKSVNFQVESNSKKHKYKPNKSVFKSKNSRNQTGRFPLSFDFSLAKVQNYVQTKTGMNTWWSVVFVLLALLLLFFLILSIVMTALYWRSQMVFPVCKTTACLRASAQILPQMNFNVSPCDDVKNFACGSWLNSKPLPPFKSIWNSKQILQYQTREKIRERIVTLSNLVTRTAPWKIKHLYESCMNLENVETDAEMPLTKILSELGGWKVMRDVEIKTWDLVKTMRILHSVYRISPFFEISLTPDPEFPSKHVIQVLPAGLGLPSKVYYEHHNSPVASAYKQFMKDVTLKLNAISTDARTFSEDMFGFEKRIAEIMPDSIHPLNITVYNKRITVGKLKEIAAMVPLQEILIAKYPNAQIDDNTQLIVPHVEYLQEISKIISTTDRGSLNNYLLWKLTSEYVGYLSESFQELVSIYKKTVTGEEKIPERWEFCIETTEKFMSFGLSVLLENSTEDKDLKTKVVTDTFHNIKNTIKNSVEGRKWPGKELQSHVLEKLSSLSLQVGYSPSMTGSEYLNEYYNKLFIVKNNFFTNVLKGMLFLQEEEQARLISTAEEYRWIDIMSASVPAIGYSIPANKVIVPHSLLVEPNFDANYMLPILYGGFGVELSAAILSSVTPWGVLHSRDGTLLNPEYPAVNQSYAYVTKAQICLSTTFASKVILNAGRSILETPYQYSTLLAISALDQAFKALKFELSKSTRMYQPAMESYNSEALFFITYAQSMCTVKTTERKNLDHTLDTSLEDSQLLEVALGQVKDFSSTFGCDSESKYFAQDVCEVML